MTTIALLMMGGLALALIQAVQGNLDSEQTGHTCLISSLVRACVTCVCSLSKECCDGSGNDYHECIGRRVGRRILDKYYFTNSAIDAV